MPRLDGTGPFGQGKKTGRGMGWCPTGPSENDNTVPGSAFPMRMGGGRGRRRGW